MKGLSIDFCRKVKEARRETGLTQGALAAEVGCKQSALSMFEQGGVTKVSDEVIDRLAKKFGIDINTKQEAAVQVQAVKVTPVAGGGFCPNPECPSNREYFVAGRRFLKPTRSEADPVGAKYCAVCGELLERVCPSCGMPVHEGAICSFCGEPYVAVLES